jgi:Zn-dependent peptidase ImmA (M78 family)
VRRGFKEEAKRLALEIRQELGLDPFARLDPHLLAELYGIPIYPLTEMDRWGCSAETLAHYADDETGSFSAALIPCGTGRMIIDNDCHASTRRRASVAHEMAHILLEHPFGAAILTPAGCRAVAPEIEAEATWLGGELLIPFRATLMWARRGASDNEVAQHHGVSLRYAGMRMNASGARKIASRTPTRRQAP